MAADPWRPHQGKKGKKGHATLSGRTVDALVLCLQRLRRDSRHIIWRKSATIWFLATFGDSRKRNIICSACPPRWRGHVLLSRDSRLCGHAIGLDSLARASRVLSPASTWRRHPRRHEQPCPSPSRARPPLALGGPGLAPVGRWPGPGPHGAPAGSGGARDRGARGQTSGVSPFSAG